MKRAKARWIQPSRFDSYINPSAAVSSVVANALRETRGGCSGKFVHDSAERDGQVDGGRVAPGPLAFEVIGALLDTRSDVFDLGRVRQLQGRDELVASLSSHRVRIVGKPGDRVHVPFNAERFTENPADRRDRAVADLMPACIVDALEVVDVDEQHADRSGVRRLRLAQQGCQILVEMTPRREARGLVECVRLFAPLPDAFKSIEGRFVLSSEPLELLAEGYLQMRRKEHGPSLDRLVELRRK